MEWESARAIEAKLGLPDQWMDQTGDAGGTGRRFSEIEMELAIRLVREAEREIGRCFPHSEFFRLVKAMAEMASEANSTFSAEDEVQFKRMLVKLFTNAENGGAHV